MRGLEHYQNAYSIARMSRDDMGVLEVVLHSGEGSLRWNLETHMQLSLLFRSIALDRENRVVLITGVGGEFLGPRADSPAGQMRSQVGSLGGMPTAADWERTGFTAQREKVGAMLDIQVPVVCGVNGPVRRHIETALLADVIIASETASFEDSAHFELQDIAPGDGVAIIARMLLGVNRARAFLLLGQVIGADEALRLGMVAEVHPQDDVLPRAREVARYIAQRSDSTLRFTRAIMVQPIKEEMLKNLGPHQAYEALAVLGR